MDKSIEDFINLAIKREEQSYAFYNLLAGKVEDKTVKETLEWMADQELKHKEFLINYKDGKFGGQSLRMAEFVDYKIAEHMDVPEEIDKDTDVYLIASHREKSAHDFYMEFAKLHEDGELKEMILRIASEEMKHKEKVEYLYSNSAFPQTSGG